MFFYWRVQQDLDCLGETLILFDPALKRSYLQWARKNAFGIALAEDFPLETLLQPNFN